MVEEVVLPDELDASFLHLSKLGCTGHTPYRGAPLVLRERNVKKAFSTDLFAFCFTSC